MQRQSLGSPSTKHLHEAHKLLQPSSSSTSSSSPNTNNINSLLNGGEEEELKKLKLMPNTTTTPETYIHLIPLLTLLCFLILYLSSHNPSQNDLAQFNGFNHLHNPSDLGENISELNGAVMEIKKGGVLAIRSLKNVKREAGDLKHRRLHRKIVNN